MVPEHSRVKKKKKKMKNGVQCGGTCPRSLVSLWWGDPELKASLSWIHREILPLGEAVLFGLRSDFSFVMDTVHLF